ncbi:MAG: purine-nucleoside phosphorylase [Bacteroidetes bacterium]|nr:purine-nucleoside phosphorylase [Bacteroidota bacterium]
MINNLLENLNETVDYIRKHYSGQPLIGVVLGSGLGNFVNDLQVEYAIEYSMLPNFPVSTVEGHGGKLIFGKMAGKNIVVMSGRFHYYEGYTPQQVVYPIRVMKMLGVKTILISNAAGGVNKSFRVGDMMIITDHISLFTVNPLVGKNIEEIGTRFPDMSEPYNKEIISKAKNIANRLGYDVKEGVYCGVTGPTFETRSEYKLIQSIGGDAVGMSTVQEVIAAVHAGLKVFAMSIITDIGIRDEDNIITHEEVLAAANATEPKMSALFKELVRML